MFIITSISQLSRNGGTRPWERVPDRSAPLLLVCRVDDLHELVGLEGRAADEAAVHIGLGQQLLGVLGVHGAAVLDGDGPGHPRAVKAPDDGADAGADLGGLPGGGGAAGADGPDGLIGDDALAHLLRGYAGQGALHLEGNELQGHAHIPLLQALAHADDGVQARLQGGVDLLVDGHVGLAEVLPPLTVADNDILDAQVLEHIGGHLAGVGAVGLKVQVLRANGHPHILERLHGGGNIHIKKEM